MGNPVLDRLLAQRQEQIDFISHLLEQVETDQRDLVDAERSNIDAAKDRIAKLDEQIKPLEDFEAVRAAHAESTVTVAPTQHKPKRLGAEAREQKYQSAGHFIVDYLRARGQQLPGGARLESDHDARQRVESALGRSLSHVEERAHQTTADTPGLLPATIVGEILNDIDGSRPFIQSVGAQPLGTVVGTKFSRPYIAQHTKVGKQTAEKQELPSQQLKINSLEFLKDTFGGWLNISRQEIDWTSPSAWNMIITDLQLIYGVETEDWAAGLLNDGVTQSVEVADDSVRSWIKAIYKAAALAATGGGTKRATSLRLPNTVWTSIDMWAEIGALLDAHEAENVNSSGAATPTSFAGTLNDLNRLVVPGLPEGTVIVGKSNMFEFYEERIGLLSAVEPKVLGIEVAYGGYAAAGFLDKTAFAKVAAPTAGV